MLDGDLRVYMQALYVLRECYVKWFLFFHYIYRVAWALWLVTRYISLTSCQWRPGTPSLHYGSILPCLSTFMWWICIIIPRFLQCFLCWWEIGCSYELSFPTPYLCDHCHPAAILGDQNHSICSTWTSATFLFLFAVASMSSHLLTLWMWCVFCANLVWLSQPLWWHSGDLSEPLCQLFEAS